MPFHVLVLLQVIGLGHGRIDQDGLRGGDGGAAAPEHGDVQCVEAGRFQAQLRGNFTRGVHVGQARRQQQASGGELGAVLLVEGDQPVLLAGGVGVMAFGGQAGLHHLGAELGERADGVEHYRCASEQGGKRLHGVGHFDHFVAGSLNAGHVGLHGGMQLVRRAARCNEGDVVLPQVFTDQPAGVAGGAVDHDGFFVAHLLSPVMQ